MDTSSPANACINREWINENQLGCTRQIENIVSQLGGEWTMMEGRSGLPEDIGAYRFQLAYAGLAIALWHFVSLSRAPSNAHWYGTLPTLRNPVKQDNIMYSAYLLLLSRPDHYLFRDARYTRQGLSQCPLTRLHLLTGWCLSTTRIV